MHNLEPHPNLDRDRDRTRNTSPLDPAGPTAGMPRLAAAAVASLAVLAPAVAGTVWGPQRFWPGLWYRWLRKPGFQPPDAVLPIAWGLIDTASAAGAYRLLRCPPSPQRSQALGWWALNVALTAGWSGLFFGRRNLPLSTLAAAAMVGSGVAYVAQSRQVDRPAAAAGVPFVAWVAFATVLTAAIWHKNR